MSSVEALIETFPKVPPTLTGALMMDSLAPRSVPKAVEKLARQGFLGFVPLGTIRRDHVALRLLPGVPLHDSPWAALRAEGTEGLTFAPRLESFVGGRLALLDSADPGLQPDRKKRDAIVAFAEEIGSGESARAVLGAIPKAARKDQPWERIAALFDAVDPGDPFCRAAAAAHRLKGPELARWADDHVRELGETKIVHSVRVGAHRLFNLPGDVIDSAWALVLGDAVLDAHYDGFTYGSGGLGGWERSPLHLAASAIEENPPSKLAGEKKVIWPAAQAFAKAPERYGGGEHLEAAAALRKSDPALAFIHLCNAAAFRVRARRRVPTEEIAAAHALAEERGWTDLSRVLGWAAKRG